MQTRLLNASLLALLLAVVSTAALSPGSSAAVSSIAYPARPSDVVVRVSIGGGFVAPSSVLGAVPTFTLFGDGTVIVPGAVSQIYPGPAIVPLVRSQLGVAQVQALLRRAARAGLLGRGSLDFGDMGTIGVSDAPTTTLTLHAGGRKVVRAAYALGIETSSGRLPPAQAKARDALRTFIAALPHGLAGTRYVPRALAVYVGTYSGQTKPGGRTIHWPLTSNLATVGTRISGGLATRCTVVGGTAARRLLTALRKADSQSRWVVRGQPGTAYGLIVRPLLPDQRNCRSSGD